MTSPVNDQTKDLFSWKRIMWFFFDWWRQSTMNADLKWLQTSVDHLLHSLKEIEGKKYKNLQVRFSTILFFLLTFQIYSSRDGRSLTAESQTYGVSTSQPKGYEGEIVIDLNMFQIHYRNSLSFSAYGSKLYLVFFFLKKLCSWLRHGQETALPKSSSSNARTWC